MQLITNDFNFVFVTGESIPRSIYTTLLNVKRSGKWVTFLRIFMIYLYVKMIFPFYIKYKFICRNVKNVIPCSKEWKIQICRINVLLQKISFATRTDYPWNRIFRACCKMYYNNSPEIWIVLQKILTTTCDSWTTIALSSFYNERNALL